MGTTDRILAEIQRDGSTRDSIAAIYREGIIKSQLYGMEFIDWPMVNRALLKRFRLSGLEYIKRIAWKADPASAPEGRA